MDLSSYFVVTRTGCCTPDADYGTEPMFEFEDDSEDDLLDEVRQSMGIFFAYFFNTFKNRKFGPPPIWKVYWKSSVWCSRATRFFTALSSPFRSDWNAQLFFPLSPFPALVSIEGWDGIQHPPPPSFASQFILIAYWKVGLFKQTSFYLLFALMGLSIPCIR